MKTKSLHIILCRTITVLMLIITYRQLLELSKGSLLSIFYQFVSHDHELGEYCICCRLSSVYEYKTFRT